jgi:lysosomal acid lipase/cholesteryl ester hydrolase
LQIATMLSKNIYISLLVIVLSTVVIEIFNQTKPKHPYAGLNIVQLVSKYGYPIETHEVVTDDGYILTLHRIPHGREKSDHRGTPVLFMHGFMQSATDFVDLGPGNALSFLLADRGYDIWLGNARGSTWSRKHKILNPDKDAAFWDYSLHEIGFYDVPAFIDYVLNATGKDSLHYVGYSQGSTTFFMLGSEKPEYIKKVKLVTALAPAIFLKHPKGPLLFSFVFFRRLLETFFELFNTRELFSRDSIESKYLVYVCNENSMFVDVCLHHHFIVQGYSFQEVNKTMLSLIYSNTPAGVSPKQMMHVAQLMESGDFHRYDLGVTYNLKRYGQKEPPRYNLSQVSTPTALYYSSNDWTVNINNIDRIVETLPNVVKRYLVPLETFNHNDFVHGKNAANLLYEAVIEEIMKY